MGRSPWNDCRSGLLVEGMCFPMLTSSVEWNGVEGRPEVAGM